jgi:hypothetical protein
MMSSDQNVKILERLVRNLKRYVDLKLESLRLDAVSRITMLISALVIGVVFFCLASLVAVMLSFAAVVYLAPIVGGYVAASGLVALFYVLVALLLIVFRRPLIIDPITRFLVSLLLSEKGELGVRDERQGNTIGDTTTFNSQRP